MKYVKLLIVLLTPAALLSIVPVPSAFAETLTYVKKQSHTIKASLPPGFKPSVSEKIEIFIVPGKGWKLNSKFPNVLRIVPLDGVDIDNPVQKTQHAKRFTDTKATFEVRVRPPAKGKAALKVFLKFAVCTEKSCVPQKEKFVIKLKLK